MSLLDQAKKVPLPKTVAQCSVEEIELAVGWLAGEVTAGQVREVAGTLTHPKSIHRWVLPRIREGAKRGLVEVKFKGGHQK